MTMDLIDVDGTSEFEVVCDNELGTHVDTDRQVTLVTVLSRSWMYVWYVQKQD